MANEIEHKRLPQIVNLQQVVDIMEKRGEIEAVQKQPGSRVAKRDAWAVARQLTDEERNQIVALAGQVGVSLLPDEPRDLTQEEIDVLILEGSAVKDAEDVVKGRYGAIRTTVFNAMNIRHSEDDEPEYVATEILSPDNGTKFVRDVRGGKPLVNWSGLAEVVPPKVWDRIGRRVVTTVSIYQGQKIVDTEQHEYWTVDENEVLAALNDGDITLDHVAAVTTLTPKTCFFYIKPITAADLQQEVA